MRLWTRDCDRSTVASEALDPNGVTAMPLFAHVLPDHVAEPLLLERWGTWHRTGELVPADGAVLGSISHADQDRVLFWMRSFRFDHDSSRQGADPFERQRAGCCI